MTADDFYVSYVESSDEDHLVVDVVYRGGQIASIRQVRDEVLVTLYESQHEPAEIPLRALISTLAAISKRLSDSN